LKTLLFDTHAHYEDKRFDNDRDDVLKKVAQAGIGGIVNVGSDIKTSKQSIALSKSHDFIYASVGVHPHFADGMQEDDLAVLEQLSKDGKVVAIGEIGLDYYYDNSRREAQKYWFAKQLTLAEKLDLPIIIHTRNATFDTLEILKNSSAKGIFHCFSGSAETARQVIDMGFYISFGGPLTYKNARHSVEAARITPIERILIETDCPYLPPDGYRGKRNDSSLMPIICRKLAEIKDISYDEAAQQTYNNAKKVYRLDN